MQLVPVELAKISTLQVQLPVIPMMYDFPMITDELFVIVSLAATSRYYTISYFAALEILDIPNPIGKRATWDGQEICRCNVIAPLTCNISNGFKRLLRLHFATVEVAHIDKCA